ncbi:MAG: ATP-binding protein [Deltaproteobacteria bacterium]|nr:ATP-binding protein [Deltaproteobacteria bacterium]
MDTPWLHPFAGCTAARSEVRTALRRSPCIALSGPEGIGKTRLLQDLAAVMGGAFRVAYLPLAALPARELASWALGAMDEEVQGDPAEALLSLANRPGEPPLLLAIDEAHAMPPASARQLADWLHAAKGRLALVAAFNPDPRTPRVRLALGGERVDVAFERPLTPEEARALVLAFVERSDPLPSRRARFDETTLAGLFATSGGLPGRLLDLARHVLEGGPAPGADGHLSLAEDFDPFSVTASADAYVARPATEHTLAALEQELAGDAPLLTMVGPPGIGKTQILRVLAGRLAGRFQTLHVAYGSLEPDELERWIAALLGATAGTSS